MAQTSRCGVIFDVDGVLVNSQQAMFNGCLNVFEYAGGSSPKTPCEFFSDITSSFGNYYRSRGAVGSDELFRSLYFDKADHEGSQWFRDVQDTIWHLSGCGVLLGVVSSHPQDRLSARFEQASLRDHFAYFAGGISHKVAALRLCANDLALPIEQTYYVGDLPVDMIHAREAGAIPLGITRGSKTREALVQAGARFCIEHLPEILDVLRLN